MHLQHLPQTQTHANATTQTELLLSPGESFNCMDKFLIFCVYRRLQFIQAASFQYFSFFLWGNPAFVNPNKKKNNNNSGERKGDTIG